MDEGGWSVGIGIRFCRGRKHSETKTKELVVLPIMKSTLKAIKCSGKRCKEVFHIYENYEPGGINDWVNISVKCKTCGAITTARMKNPSKYGVFENCEILDAWEDDEYYENESTQMGETAIVIGEQPAEGAPFNFIPNKDYPFWRNGETNLEEVSYNMFSSIDNLVGKEIKGLYNYIVKSPPGYDNLERCVVSQEYEFEGKPRTAIWGKILNNDSTFSTGNFHLIGHSDNDFEIDGVFPRDEMMEYLFRCLMRWKLIANQVVVVTPFIGFDFPFSKEKDRKGLIALWELLNSVLDIEKTTFITRVKTYGSLKNCQKELEVPADVLREWDLMNNLQKMVDNPKTRVKTRSQFHAKFYAGVFDTFVEFLSGSFNVQTGSVLEQMHLRRVSRELFKSNYLDRLMDGFSFEPTYNPKTYSIHIGKDNTVDSKIIDLNSIVSVSNDERLSDYISHTEQLV